MLDSAAGKLKALNPEFNMRKHDAQLSSANALDISSVLSGLAKLDRALPYSADTRIFRVLGVMERDIVSPRGSEQIAY